MYKYLEIHTENFPYCQQYMSYIDIYLLYATH